MKKQIQSWLVTLAVIFVSTFSFHACGDDEAALFAFLGELTGGSLDSSMLASGANSVCGEACDGVIPDAWSADVGGTLDGESGHSVSIFLSDGTTPETFTVTADVETGDITAADAETMMINMINDTETGSMHASASAGSVVVTPFDQLNLPSQEFSSENGGVWTSPTNDVNDTQALSALLLTIFGQAIGTQELIDEAVTDEVIDTDNNETRDVALSAYQEDDCAGGGTLRLTQSVVVEIDAMEMQSDDEAFEQFTIAFTNCELTGDFLGVGNMETIIFNGSVTVTDIETDGGSSSIASGTITLDTDDGTMAADPFWVDRINFNTSEELTLPTGPGSTDYDGGVCFGGAVTRNFNGDDTDDGCTGDGIFVSTSNFANYADSFFE